jgi:hypothetical protein
MLDVHEHGLPALKRGSMTVPFAAINGRSFTGKAFSLRAIGDQRTGVRKRTLPSDSVVKMSFFALDFGIEMPYPLTPPQGWEVHFDL